LSSILPKKYPQKNSIHPNNPLVVSSSSPILHCHHIVTLSSPIIIHYLNVKLTKLKYPLHHATQVQSIFFTKMARFAMFKVWHLVPKMSFWDMGLTTLMCVSCHFVPSWVEDWSMPNSPTKWIINPCHNVKINHTYTWSNFHFLQHIIFFGFIFWKVTLRLHHLSPTLLFTFIFGCQIGSILNFNV
jgi:hypothetical protein